MAGRPPPRVLRRPACDMQVAEWRMSVLRRRGQEAKAAKQRVKELERLERVFPTNPFHGANVPKDRIPHRYVAMGATNLFRNDLPGGWRLMHTVVEVERVRTVLILEALPHDDYDRVFGYRGR